MSAPVVGNIWTDVDLIEPAWWRDYRWTVVSANQSGDAIHVWLLRPEPATDGSFPDVSVGIITLRIGHELARATWSSRGWVARSNRVDLAIATAPGFPDPPLVAISERFADADGRLGVSEYFFRLEHGSLRLIDELVTVAEDGALAYESGFVPGSALTFRTTADGQVLTFVFDDRPGRFTLRKPRR